MSDSTVVAPGARAWLRLPRLGIIGQVLLPAAIVLVAAISGTSALLLRDLHASKTEDVQRSLDVNLALLKDQLRPLGTAWQTDGTTLKLGDTVLNGNIEVVDRVKAIAGGVATVFLGDTRITTNVARPDGTRGVGTKLAPGPAYDAAITRGQTYRGENVILGRRHLTVYEPIRGPQGQQIGLLFVGMPVDHVDAYVAAEMQKAAMVAGIAAVVAVLLSFLLMRRTLRPLVGLRGAMAGMAEGRLDATVPHTDRPDELGAMARAMETLRARLAQAAEAAAALDAERAQAGEGRRRARIAMADDFERRVQGIADDVAGAAQRLASQAEGIVAAINATEGVASTVREASGQAAGSVQNVAAAAEELSASIGEISRQVAASATAAQGAAEESRRTDARVEDLNQAAARIGDVVRLIGDIAGQTNLLALNATIEAARAGEAGKGFAVVAGEVKNLAGQTAKATEEIGAQIAAMQAATTGAVEAIRAIGGRIGEISELAASVASAVEEQGAATSEIAGSVQQAAVNTGHVNTAIGRVGESAASAASGGDAIRRDAGTLSGQAEALRTAVRGLVSELRAA